MGLIEGGIAFFGLLFATILSALALWNRVSKWLENKEREREERFKQMVIDAIADRGLIKPGQEGIGDEAWPNGSHNMPDFLRVLWESLEATQASLHAIRTAVQREHDLDFDLGSEYPRSLDD